VDSRQVFRIGGSREVCRARYAQHIRAEEQRCGLSALRLGGSHENVVSRKGSKPKSVLKSTALASDTTTCSNSRPGRGIEVPSIEPVQSLENYDARLMLYSIKYGWPIEWCFIWVG